jgi:hypothetical protein
MTNLVAELSDLTPVSGVPDTSKFLVSQPDGSTIRASAEDIANFIRTANGISPAGAPFLGASVTLATTSPDIPNGPLTAVDWDTPTLDTSGIWNPGNPSRLTVPAGVSKVRVWGTVRWEYHVSGIRVLFLAKNDSFDYQGAGGEVTIRPYTSGVVNTLSCSTAPVSVSPGDYFTAQVLQNSGGVLRVLSGYQNSFNMEILETT